LAPAYDRGTMRACAARPDGSLEVLVGSRPAVRSGSVLRAPDTAELTPAPEGTALMHLPGRRAMGLDRRGIPLELDPERVAVAAVLPVGYLRTLLPASRPLPGSPRLPLYGYAAVVEDHGRLLVAAQRTDSWELWNPQRYGGDDLPAAVDAARAALQGNRLVGHLAVCALQNRCYTAQNTFLRRYEGALPASPACNADCLGCISLQSDGEVPAPHTRMEFAPTAAELAELAAWHLQSADASIISFGQGCEGEPLTRDEVLVEATRRIRSDFPGATIHINTNGSSPRMLQRLIDAGCNSVRISAISFTEAVFRSYYRPVGYSLADVLACGLAMSRAGGQVCLNLLSFPGLTDDPVEIERTLSACRDMGVDQVQWRSLNVDHDWLIRVLDAAGVELGRGIGMLAAQEHVHAALPGVEHGNFTRPVAMAR
jgi:pyruvate-formate lyase-activating enzyme